MTTTYSEILINSVERETEKAVKVAFPVAWGRKTHERSFWIPKSLVKIINEKSIQIAQWFIDRLSYENSFNGYDMFFFPSDYFKTNNK